MTGYNGSYKISRIHRIACTLFLFAAILTAFSIGAAADEVPVDRETIDLNIKAAYNDENIHFLFEFDSAQMQYPGIYHDYYRFEDGEWVRDGYNEDRMTMLLGGHQVNYFDTLGCFVTCHDDVRFMPDSPSAEEVGAHEYLGGVLGVSDVRKYIPETRGDPLSWDNIVSQEELDQLREDGVFLDLIHWRAHRSNPVGYSDSQHILEFRHSDTGQSPYYTNWDDDNDRPAYMFDPEVTGFVALDWEDVRDRNLGMDDYYYLAEEFAVPFDSEYEWQEGDTIPRRIITAPTESRGQITADGTWSEGTWTVELVRKLDTGYQLEDLALSEGEVYYISPAVHIGDTSGRDHYVTWGHSLGIGTEADVEAVRFTGQSPEWNEVPGTTISLFYPSVFSYASLFDGELHGTGIVCTEAGAPVPHGAERMGEFGFELERSLAEPVDPEPEPEPEPEPVPGFGVLLAISGTLAAVYLMAKIK